MSRLDSIFASRKKVLIPFLVAGDPSIEETSLAIVDMALAGADIIEIGFPFSDPIADGPVIAAAMHRTLEDGVRTSDIVDLIAKVRRQEVEIGLVAMVSYSIVKKSGWKNFIDRFSRVGIDGFIIPDIDERDAQFVGEYCKSIDVSFSMLIAPTTPMDRVKQLADLSSGFLYILARTGLTGEQAQMPALASRIEEIRKVTTLPLAVGFGISTAEHVRAVYANADAAIVGSALVRRMEESDDPVQAAKQFVLEIT